MAPRTISPQKLQKIRELAAEWGKIVAREAAGPDGAAADDLDFAAMEQIALAAAAGLTRGTLQTLHERQAAVVDDHVPCPDCRTPCLVRREARDLVVPGGIAVPLDEPVCHCPGCRRDFFPPPAPPAAG